jgi:hypothetical protein
MFRAWAAVLPSEELGQRTDAGERRLQHVEATPGGVVQRHHGTGAQSPLDGVDIVEFWAMQGAQKHPELC